MLLLFIHWLAYDITPFCELQYSLVLSQGIVGYIKCDQAAPTISSDLQKLGKCDHDISENQKSVTLI